METFVDDDDDDDDDGDRCGGLQDQSLPFTCVMVMVEIRSGGWRWRLWSLHGSRAPPCMYVDGSSLP